MAGLNLSEAKKEELKRAEEAVARARNRATEKAVPDTVGRVRQPKRRTCCRVSILGVEHASVAVAAKANDVAVRTIYRWLDGYSKGEEVILPLPKCFRLEN